MPTLHVENLRALHRVSMDLAPGVSVLTGANGSGKTTLLLVLKLLRATFDRGLPEAVSLVLGGSANLRSHAADADERIEVGVDVGRVSWRVSLLTRGASVDDLTDERLEDGGTVVFLRNSLGQFQYRGVEQSAKLPPERTGLRWLADAHPEDEAVKVIADFVGALQVFHDLDFAGLRDGGSKVAEDRHVHATGRNVLTMLRKWRDRRGDAVRVRFVEDGMKAAFPAAFDGFDFEARQTVSASVYRPGFATPTPIENEANGLIAMLMVLVALASSEAGGFVAVDEPETALHPFAIRSLVESARSWAALRQATILFTTHSPVLLDAFNGEPERIWAMEAEQGRVPVRLSEIRNREWLAGYTLGELYVGGDFSSTPPALAMPRARVRLVVTGDLERIALWSSLARMIDPREETLELLGVLQVNGMTSAPLPDPTAPADPMKPDGDRVATPTAVTKFARALIAATCEARRASEPLPDLVLGVDDLELGNLEHPGRVVGWVRRALKEEVDGLAFPAERSRRRDALRARCSFHLLAPLVEAYFFGEDAALARAGVPKGMVPQIADPSDVERFAVTDPAFLVGAHAANQAKKLAGIDWWREDCHPKSYLQHLVATDRGGSVYRETVQGKAALARLDWRKVGARGDAVPLARALFEDIANLLGVANVMGTLHTAVPTWAAPEARPAERWLRNV